MKNEERLSRMRDVFKQVDSQYGKDALDEVTDPQEEADPYLDELIAQAWEIQKKLDPLVREAMRDNPEALAEWDEIMHMCVADGLDPDEPGPDKS